MHGLLNLNWLQKFNVYRLFCIQLNHQKNKISVCFVEMDVHVQNCKGIKVVFPNSFSFFLFFFYINSQLKAKQLHLKKKPVREIKNAMSTVFSKIASALYAPGAHATLSAKFLACKNCKNKNSGHLHFLFEHFLTYRKNAKPSTCSNLKHPFN